MGGTGVHRCSIVRDNIADEAIAPYWGEPSCVFDLAESLPPGLRSRFHHFAPDESPAMASAKNVRQGQFVLFGLKGSGKTQIYLKYVQAHHKRYGATLTSGKAVN
jgi:hypothetical protein